MKQQTALNKLSAMFEQCGVDHANVIVSKDKHNLKPNIGFGMVFPQVISALLDDGFTAKELQTFMKVCELVEFSNALSITQTTIAKQTNTDKATISKHFKKFYTLGLLFKDEDGSVWINPVVFAKGKLWDFKNNKIIYQKAVELANNLGLEEPPF